MHFPKPRSRAYTIHFRHISLRSLPQKESDTILHYVLLVFPAVSSRVCDTHTYTIVILWYLENAYHSHCRNTTTWRENKCPSEFRSVSPPPSLSPSQFFKPRFSESHCRVIRLSRCCKWKYFAILIYLRELQFARTSSSVLSHRTKEYSTPIP